MWDWSNSFDVRVVGRGGVGSERLAAALSADHGLNIVGAWPESADAGKKEGESSSKKKSPKAEAKGESSANGAGSSKKEDFSPSVTVYDAGYVDRQAFDDVIALHRSEPQSAILLVAEGGEGEFVLTSLRAGARGCVLYGPGLICDLNVAVRSLSRGQGFLCPETAKIVLERALWVNALQTPSAEILAATSGRNAAAKKKAALSAGSDEFGRLTPREREVLKLVAEGHSTPIIAGLLDISAKTVEGHRGRIMAKLKVHNVAGLVRRAIRAGMIAA